MRRPAADHVRSDRGFSLIELVVAMGIFGLLMVIVGTLSISAFRAIREATQRSEIQTQSQNAMEWVSRLMRYADEPQPGYPALENASATGLTAYTYSGTGEVADAPYRARLFTEVQADGTTDVLTEITTPTRVSGEWAWTGIPMRRRLLSVPAGVTGSPLRVQYFVCNPADECANPQPYTPDGSGPLLDATSPLVPAYLVISLGDPSVPDRLVTQTVKLENLA